MFYIYEINANNLGLNIANFYFFIFILLILFILFFIFPDIYNKIILNLSAIVTN